MSKPILDYGEPPEALEYATELTLRSIDRLAAGTLSASRGMRNDDGDLISEAATLIQEATVLLDEATEWNTCP